MRREAINNDCWWHSSFREVLPKCTYEIHCWKFYLLYAALCPPLHVERTQWFFADLVTLLVSLLLQQCRYWSSIWLLCTFAEFCMCTRHWAVCSLSSHRTCCFFSVRQRKIRWLSLLSCEPAWLRDTGAVHGLPRIIIYMTHCAGLVRKKTAWKIQMSYLE